MTTTVKERPILFSGPMVRAILEDRKTQTRRVVKPQPTHDEGGVYWKCPHDMPGIEEHSPYGVTGDRLWVKERWFRPTTFTTPRGNWKKGGRMCVGYPDALESRWVDCDRDMYNKVLAMKPGLRPSLFMPRWASRITLEVVSVRVERLQDISEADAKAEGVEPYRCPQADALMNAVGGGMKPIPYTSGFANLWNEINGKSHPWSSNPFVWVVEFRRVP